MHKYLMILFLVFMLISTVSVFKDLSTVKTNVLLIVGGVK